MKDMKGRKGIIVMRDPWSVIRKKNIISPQRTQSSQRIYLTADHAALLIFSYFNVVIQENVIITTENTEVTEKIYEIENFRLKIENYEYSIVNDVADV